MMLNEIRKDYLLDRWVVIATHRKRRPTDFPRKKATTRQFDKASCPFCPGNERKTPPAVLVYLEGKNGIQKKKDTNGLRQKNWLIRCVPNLYSAFSPPEKGVSFESGRAVGHHEVLIESPSHDEHPGEARIPQLIHVINGYIDRLRDLSSKPYVKYVSIFRNHGLDAGASLSHAHSQIMATPMVPKVLKDEMQASSKFFRDHSACVFCEILKEEVKGPRFIGQNESFVTFTPKAGVHPFEFWIAPKKHEATLLNLGQKAVKDLAYAMKSNLGSLKMLLKDPPYNFGFHLAQDAQAAEFYHWHLEVYPKLTIWAGFEKSTGMYINVVPPEDAAVCLKQAAANHHEA